MAKSLQAILVTSVVAAYFLASRRNPRKSLEWSLFSNFLVAWLIQMAGWTLWKVLLYPKVFSPLRGLPEPKDNSFFNGQFAKIKKEKTGIPMTEWNNTIPNNGLIRYLGILNQERLLVTGPEALSEVLVKKNYDFAKPEQFRWSVGRVLGIGILMAEGDEHKIQRKNLMPAFAFRHVKDLYPVFWGKAAESIEAMTEQVRHDASYSDSDIEKAGTAVLEVSNWASRATLDIIGIAGLGRDFQAIRNPDNKLNQTYQDLFRPQSPGFFVILLGLLLPGWALEWLPMERNGTVQKASRFIRETCADLVRAKKEKLARADKRTDVDILSVALESGGFSDENLVDQLMTFLAAGHETTASAMTWAIYMLCLNPEVQERLRAEIREQLPSPSAPGATVSALDIDHLPYLNAVCSEVLRYYGPVPMTLRETARDTSILGQKVPKGTRVILCPWAVNKSLELWGGDAMEFRPERWLPQQGQDGESDGKHRTASGGAESNYAFMTFLHGPRSCIGASFAKAEFACLLATWVGRFEFELRDQELHDEEKMEIKGGITARPSRGLHVKTRVVEGW